MTSSLVGSEMCIRDRLQGAHVALFLLGQACFVFKECVEKNEGSTYRAVSYTHLTLPTICSV
eukprot:8349274-Prorocentrum_lima.AAC.1